MSAQVEVTISEDRDTDALLRKLPIQMRGKAVKRALRRSGGVVRKRARRLVSKPGYPGDKPDKKPLRDTIGLVVRDYGETFVCVVGPQYPAGAHGHLLEFGHRKVTPAGVVGFVEPRPFMRPAAEETRGEQRSVFIATITEEIEKLL